MEAVELAVDKIVNSEGQPRKHFDEAALGELAESIRDKGLLQPIIVKPIGEGFYEIVAGERRWRATRVAGGKTIQCLIRNVADEAQREVALIENLQREDLNDFELALSMTELVGMRLGLSDQDAVSLMKTAYNHFRKKEEDPNIEKIERVFRSVYYQGAWTTFVSHLLPLLTLPADLLELAREGRLEYTKLNTLSRVKDAQLRQHLTEKVLREELSKAKVERLVRDQLNGSKDENIRKPLVNRLNSVQKMIKRARLDEVLSESIEEEIERFERRIARLINMD